MFSPMMASACPDCVWGFSVRSAHAMALRTSGGRFVEVWMISSSMLSLRNCINTSGDEARDSVRTSLATVELYPSCR